MNWRYWGTGVDTPIDVYLVDQPPSVVGNIPRLINIAVLVLLVGVLIAGWEVGCCCLY